MKSSASRIARRLGHSLAKVSNADIEAGVGISTYPKSFLIKKLCTFCIVIVTLFAVTMRGQNDTPVSEGLSAPQIIQLYMSQADHGFAAFRGRSLGPALWRSTVRYRHADSCVIGWRAAPASISCDIKGLQKDDLEREFGQIVDAIHEAEPSWKDLSTGGIETTHIFTGDLSPFIRGVNTRAIAIEISRPDRENLGSITLDFSSGKDPKQLDPQLRQLAKTQKRIRTMDNNLDKVDFFLRKEHLSGYAGMWGHSGDASCGQVDRMQASSDLHHIVEGTCLFHLRGFDSIDLTDIGGVAYGYLKAEKGWFLYFTCVYNAPCVDTFLQLPNGKTDSSFTISNLFYPSAYAANPSASEIARRKREVLDLKILLDLR